MAKRSYRKRQARKTSYRNKSANGGCLGGAIILLLILIISNPIRIFDFLTLANIFFLWKLRKRESISDVVFFNVLGGCLTYLVLGFFSYVNSELPENERILSFIYLNFSQEQSLLVFLSAFGMIILMPTILSAVTIDKRNYKNKQIRAEQEQRRIQAEQEARRSQEEYYKKLSEVLISTNREDYIIVKEDYKRGNKRENEYRKKHILALLNLHQNQCAKCHKSDNGFDLDHFFLSKNEGGNFSLMHKDGYLVNNAIPLCQSCNRSKGDRPYNTFFSNEEILSLFTNNREMTLLLNQIQSSEHLQLEIKGVLPGENRPEIMIDEDKGGDFTTFQVSSSDPTQLADQLDLPEPAQLVIHDDLGQNYNTENLFDNEISKSSDHKISQVITSKYGFRTNFWPDKITKKKWAEFMQIGPEYAMPIKRTACSSPFLDSPGSVYAGLYAKDKFDNLAHFQIYNLFTSSGLYHRFGHGVGQAISKR
jgi:hypothetical protein